jgi:hypothetical protein
MKKTNNSNEIEMPAAGVYEWCLLFMMFCRLEAECRGMGSSGVVMWKRYKVLMFLGEVGHGYRVRSIASELGEPVAAVVELVKRMIGERIVADAARDLKPDGKKKDEDSMIVELTNEGRYEYMRIVGKFASLYEDEKRIAIGLKLNNFG